MKKNTSNTDEVEKRTQRALENALRQVFGENQDARRFIDITRIPLICQSINGIHESLQDLKSMISTQKEQLLNEHEKFVSKDEFNPVKYIAFGAAGMILTGFTGAVLSLVFLK